jgi:hypothetical protein
MVDIMQHNCFALAFWLALVSAQDSPDDFGISILTGTSDPTGSVTDLPSGTYLSYESTQTVTALGSITILSGLNIAGTTGIINGSNATTTSSTTSAVTLLGGTRAAGTLTGHGTATSTSSSAQPTNTTPCNNYPEFCARKYGNITGVAAHNSAIDVKGNAASNQKYGAIYQLNDGIRLLQTESHWPNSTCYLCHTSCDILNVGSLESWLTTTNGWVAAHPYDVVTLLIGNQDFRPVTDYVAPFQNSGITRYVYTPAKIPMGLEDWPTLARMILTGQRVVVFMDYEADQSKVPWILDEFSHMWETPFNPTTQSFPCTAQRPPNNSKSSAEDRLFILNHNLNTEVSLLGTSLLVPTVTLLNVTNNVTGYGSLGLSADNCVEEWSRP